MCYVGVVLRVIWWIRYLGGNLKVTLQEYPPVNFFLLYFLDRWFGFTKEMDIKRSTVIAKVAFCVLKIEILVEKAVLFHWVKNDFFTSLIDSPSTHWVLSTTSSTNVNGTPHYSCMSKLRYMPVLALEYLMDHSHWEGCLLANSVLC